MPPELINLTTLTWEEFLELPEERQMELRGLLTSGLYNLAFGMRSFRFDLCKRLFESSLELYEAGEISDDDVLAAQRTLAGAPLPEKDLHAFVVESTVALIAAIDSFIKCRDEVLGIYSLVHAGRKEEPNAAA